MAGYGNKFISGSSRNVFLFMTSTMTLPNFQHLFSGSQTEPADINSHGHGWLLSLAQAAVTTFSSGLPPEITAFIYEHNNATANVIDLNERIACDSGYYLAQATGVNDNGEILADAVTSRQETDDAGNKTVDMIVPVKLVPR